MAVVLAITTGSVVACTGKPALKPSPTPSVSFAGNLVDEPATVKPLALSGSPVWGSNAHGPVGKLGHVEFRDDTAIVVGDQDQLAVVDAGTGAAQWSYESYGGELRGGGAARLGLGPFTGDPKVVGVGDAWSVLVPYVIPSTPDKSEEQGIAALSGKDGSVRWHTRLVGGLARDDQAGLALRLVDADNNTALVAVEPANPDASGSPQGVALDVSTGAVRWRRDEMRLSGVAGDTVLGQPAHGAAPVGRFSGQVVALDAGTGARRWDLAKRWPVSLPVSATVGLTPIAAGDSVLVRGFVGNRPVDSVVLNVRTGRELADLGASVDWCATDRRTIFACEVDVGSVKDARIATFRVDDHKLRVSKKHADMYTIDGVWQDRIFIAGSPQMAQGHTVDRSANRLGGSLPAGTLVAISDRYAAFRDSTGTYAVYRITS